MAILKFSGRRVHKRKAGAIASGLPTNRELIGLPIRPACAGSERIRLQVNLPDRLPVGLRCSPARLSAIPLANPLSRPPERQNSHT